MTTGQILHLGPTGVIGCSAQSGELSGQPVGGLPGTFNGTLGYGRAWTTGDDVRLRFLARDSTGATVTVAVKAYDASNNLISTVCSGSVISTTWAVGVAAGTVPSGCAMLRTELTASYTVSELTGVEVLVNGDLWDGGNGFGNLSLDTSGGGTPANWTVSSGTWAIDSTGHLIGAGCAKCTAAGEMYQQASIPVSHGTGDLMLVSCWQRYSHAGDDLTLDVEVRDGSNSVLDTLKLTQAGRSPVISGEWFYRSGQLFLPSGAVSIRLRARCLGLGAGSAGVRLDQADLMLLAS